MEYIYVCSWHIDVRRVANRQLFVGLFSRVMLLTLFFQRRLWMLNTARFWDCGRGSLGRGGGVWGGEEG